MTDFDPGVVIDGRYRILSRVGAGGMADVYLAQDEQLGREVALKLLHRRFAQDPGFVERFRREAQAAASLQHPNVVSVFDRGEVDGAYYIAMEYLPGRSLKQLIRDEAPIEATRAIDITVQILKAARFAHRRGVIHRDLKPHNVIVDDGDHAKVTDFGIARAGASDMTETGSIMGTAQYLSPEQAQGHAVSAPSDLYSVGVILYEMLTAQVPFDGESPVTIALKHVSEAPLPPTQLNPEVPAALEQVVLWTLNKNPADRPANADQLIEALEQVRSSLTGGGSTASMSPVAAGAAIVPATTVLPAYGSAQNLMTGEQLDRYDDEEDERRPMWPWIVGILLLLAIAGGVLAFLLTRPEKVVVPSVTNLTLPVAETRIQSAGLRPDPISQTSSQPSGTVIGQSPLSNIKVNKGSSVLLYVSSGPGNVTVQSVAGLSQTDAVKLLQGMGLKVNRTLYETSSSVPKGSAIETDPAAGESVPKGTGVTLYVSKGKPHVAAKKARVPYVVGETLSQAQSSLLTNFNVQVTYQTTSTAPANTVTAQSPTANTMLPKGSTVAITVAKAPGKVPDVTGFTASAATSALRSDGYAVRQTYQAVTDSSQNNIVISQSPRGNTAANKGATVTIVIGHYAGGSTTTTGGVTTTPTTSTNGSAASGSGSNP